MYTVDALVLGLRPQTRAFHSNNFHTVNTRNHKQNGLRIAAIYGIHHKLIAASFNGNILATIKVSLVILFCLETGL